MTPTPTDEPTLQERADGYFLQACNGYCTKFEALTDLLLSTLPHVRGLDLDKLKELESILPDVPSDRLTEVMSVLREHNGLPSGQVLAALYDRFSQEPWGSALVLALYKDLHRPARVPIFVNSLLSAAVSSFESQLAIILRGFFDCAPAALDAASREKEFSLSDLKAIDSIEEARQVAVRRRVDDLLYGSFSSWKKFFLDKAKIDFESLAMDWVSTQEIFERRHTIVHNSGSASARYVRAVGNEGVDVGAALATDEAYLKEAFDELLALGFLVTAETWSKFVEDKNLLTSQVSDLSYRMLVQGRYRLAARLGQYGINCGGTDAAKQTSQVNLWLARIGLGERGQVSGQIEDWDVSAASDRFKLAKACLVGDLDTAFDLLAALVEAGEISGADLLAWPLLEPVRQDVRFEALNKPIRESLIEASQPPATVRLNSRSTIYHESGCRRAGADTSAVSLAEAVDAGARPCRSCMTGLVPLLPGELQ